MTKIFGIKALQDNYIWAIHGIDSSRIIVVDPGEAQPVLTYLNKNKLKLDAILLTHHHWDHTGGVAELLKHYPHISIYGSKIDQVPGITHFVDESHAITLPNFNYPIKIMNIPGHTLGHIAYLYDKALFCGDTLFSCGCGRIFEGTPEQMFESLQKLAHLPLDTLIYCGHEYTLKNITFAQTLEPNNKFLAARKAEVENLRNQNLPSLPVLLSTELETNPFLRSHEPVILASLKKQGYINKNNLVHAFSYIRELKNNF
jgi:hydroxyacylglutathione hydrolase